MLYSFTHERRLDDAPQSNDYPPFSSQRSDLGEGGRINDTRRVIAEQVQKTVDAGIDAEGA